MQSTLPLSHFKSATPTTVFAQAQDPPEFFSRHLVHPDRRIKVLRDDPLSHERVFYYQLLRVCEGARYYESEATIKRIIVVLESEDVGFQLPQGLRQAGHSEEQFRRLGVQFMSLLAEPTANLDQLLTSYPIIDSVFSCLLRSILIYSRASHSLDQPMQKMSVYSQLCGLFSLTYEGMGSCGKFAEADLFVYEQTADNVYMAYIDEKFDEMPRIVMNMGDTSKPASAEAVHEQPNQKKAYNCEQIVEDEIEQQEESQDAKMIENKLEQLQLDFRQQFRNLPVIESIEQQAVEATPQCHRYEYSQINEQVNCSPFPLHRVQQQQGPPTGRQSEECRKIINPSLSTMHSSEAMVETNFIAVSLGSQNIWPKKQEENIEEITDYQIQDSRKQEHQRSSHVRHNTLDQALNQETSNNVSDSGNFKSFVARPPITTVSPDCFTSSLSKTFKTPQLTTATLGNKQKNGPATIFAPDLKFNITKQFTNSFVMEKMSLPYSENVRRIRQRARAYRRGFINPS